MMMINMFGIINISGIVFATITIIIVISCYFYVQTMKQNYATVTARTTS
jgi:hypothetical protein